DVHLVRSVGHRNVPGARPEELHVDERVPRLIGQDVAVARERLGRAVPAVGVAVAAAAEDLAEVGEVAAGDFGAGGLEVDAEGAAVGGGGDGEVEVAQTAAGPRVVGELDVPAERAGQAGVEPDGEGRRIPRRDRA